MNEEKKKDEKKNLQLTANIFILAFCIFMFLKFLFG
jgi:hypothetical protein